MNRYEDNPSVSIRPDPSHYGSYRVELKAEIPGRLETAEKALRSCGFLACDFDQWGMSFLSRKEPDLTAEVDEVSDYGDSSQLALYKSKLSRNDIGGASEFLQQIYRQIIDKIDIRIEHSFLV
jgi:hypothetical protein